MLGPKGDCAGENVPEEKAECERGRTLLEFYTVLAGKARGRLIILGADNVCTSCGGALCPQGLQNLGAVYQPLPLLWASVSQGLGSPG